MEIGIFLNEGNKQIKFLRFTQSAIDIGRSQGCHLHLNDPMLAQGTWLYLLERRTTLC